MARIVYVGRMFEGSSAAFRARSLERLGHEVHALECHPPEPGPLRLVRGLRRRHGLGPSHPVNAALVAAVAARRPELLWVDKGLHVSAAALRAARAAAPGLRSVHYSLDDYRIPGNRSHDMLAALPEYDLVVTTKSYDLEWLRAHGARRPFMSWQGYDEEIHRPPGPGEADPSLAGRVVLIGGWEAERAAAAEALAAAGVPVSALSPQRQWEDSVRRCPALDWRRWEVYGRAYAVALGSGAIGLGVLRKVAADLHTQRSVEIPACGVALLAERTSEHLALFEEGVEAEFYGSLPECVQKARALLADPARLARLAEAGRRRCLAGGYAWTDRVRQILEALDRPAQDGGPLHLGDPSR